MATKLKTPSLYFSRKKYVGPAHAMEDWALYQTEQTTIHVPEEEEYEVEEI